MIESIQDGVARRMRGGRRPGAGRPPAYREPLLRKTVTLPVSYVEQLAAFGAGNLSEGIRPAGRNRLHSRRQALARPTRLGSVAPPFLANKTFARVEGFPTTVLRS